jgi:hypothetical protein
VDQVHPDQNVHPAVNYIKPQPPPDAHLGLPFIFPVWIGIFMLGTLDQANPYSILRLVFIRAIARFVTR